MRVLLVNTNRYRFMSPWPGGLAFLAQGLAGRGHEVEICDLMFARRPKRELTAAMARLDPGLVGFTIRNLDNQSMADPRSPLPEIRDLVSLARERGLPTVLGGTAFGTLPAPMLDFMQADHGIAGQGEEGLPRLVESLEAGTLDSEIPGLVWRDDEQQIRTNAPSFRGYTGLSARWDLMQIKGYRNSMMPASVLVKTGCSYRCSYCDAQATFGDCFNFRDPAEIIEELRAIRRHHRIASFFLVDPCFNAPLDRAKLLLEAMVQARLGVMIIAIFMPAPGTYDDEFFDLYRRAGGRFGMLGSESFSEAMLDSYDKPFGVSDIIDFGQMARRHGVKFGVDLLFGGPGETEQTVQESINNFARVPYSFAECALGIRLLPAAPMFATALEHGQVSPADDLLMPKFYVAEGLDLERTDLLLKRGTRKYARRAAGMLPIGLRSVAARYLNFTL